MPNYCCAPRCPNSDRRGYAMFGFPKDFERCKKWINAAKENWHPLKSARLCEVHFKPEDIITVGRRRTIHSKAVPSRFCKCNHVVVTWLTTEWAHIIGTIDQISKEHNYCALPIPVSKEKNLKHKNDCCVLSKPLQVYHEKEDKCKKRFDTSEEYDQHLNTYSGICQEYKLENYLCGLCGNNFDTKQDLDCHQKTHNVKGYSLECNRCSKKYSSVQCLKRHIQRVHIPVETNNKVQCDKCGKLVKYNSILLNHKRLVHSESSLQCPECPRKYAALMYLKRHIKVMHRTVMNKNGQTKYIRNKSYFLLRNEQVPCKICGKYFKGIFKLKLHLRTHVLTKRFICKHCGIALQTAHNLKKHEKLHTNEGTLNRCYVCWKKFQTAEEVDQHMTKHNPPKHQCTECGEHFYRKILLNNHIILNHSTHEELDNSLKTVIKTTINSLIKEKARIIEADSDEEVPEVEEQVAVISNKLLTLRRF